MTPEFGDGFGEDMDMLEACPVCGRPLATFSKVEVGLSSPDSGLFYRVECVFCGHYSIDAPMALGLKDGERLPGPRHLVTGTLRERSVRKSPVRLDWDNVEDVVATARVPRSPGEKADRLLQNMALLTPAPGMPYHLDKKNDLPLAFAETWNEVDYYVLYLMERGLLVHRDTLTVEGWSRVQELENTGQNSVTAFIAMDFSKVMDPAHAAIRRAVARTKRFEPLRVDDRAAEHLGMIDDLIIAEIRKSRFVIADFTNQKGGVYFEAGMALGMGLPVVWCCRHDDVEGNKLHFDTRQFAHIVWTSESDLEEQLYHKIEAVIP